MHLAYTGFKDSWYTVSIVEFLDNYRKYIMEWFHTYGSSGKYSFVGKSKMYMK